MRLWLDDYRKPPTGQAWTWAKTAAEAIAHLKTGEVAFISLDHDLADEHYVSTPPPEGSVPTGYDVAAYIEKAVAAGEIPMPEWQIHSMNPVGRDRMRAAMISAERLARAAEVPA